MSLRATHGSLVFSAVLILGACNAIFGVEVFDPIAADSTGGGGAATGTSGTGGDGSGAGGNGSGAGSSSSSTAGAGGVMVVGVGGSGGAPGSHGGFGGIGGGLDCSAGGAGGAGGASLPSCDSAYGTAPNYVLCEQSSNKCAFSFNSTVASCAQVCASAGGSCVYAVNDVSNMLCTPSSLGSFSCGGVQFTSAICVCTRPCG